MRRLAKLIRRFRRSATGSASLELALAASLAVTMSAAAADLGRMLSAQVRLEGAVRDATRLLARTPLDEEAALLTGGVERARAELAARLAEAELAPAPLPDRPAGAVCDQALTVCHRLEPLAGAEAALGGARRLVRVWAGARVEAGLIAALQAARGGGEFPSGLRISARLHQVHAP